MGDVVELAATATSGLRVDVAASGSCRLEAGSLVAVGAGTCVLTASQAGDADWLPAEPVVRRIAIAPASQAVELAPIPDLAVGDVVELAASATSGLPVELAASGPCLVSEGRLRTVGAGPCTITASQAGDDDWQPAEPVTRTVRISRGPQALELAAIPDTVFGAPPLALEAHAGSGLPVAFAVEGPCRVRDGSLESTGAGTCVLTASQAGDADWAPAEPVVRRIAIAPASQALELAALPDLSVGDVVELAATATSGLRVDVAASGSCRLEAGSLVAVGAGTCVLTASQAGDADWLPAEPVVRRIAIAPASQAVELAPITGPGRGRRGRARRERHVRPARRARSVRPLPRLRGTPPDRRCRPLHHHRQPGRRRRLATGGAGHEDGPHQPWPTGPRAGGDPGPVRG